MKLKNTSLCFLLAIIFFFPQRVFANDLEITNVKLQARYPTSSTVTVEFDITWNNSWRDGTNYDAVWLFLKVLKGGTWYHGMLATSGTNPSNMSAGTDLDLDLVVPSDKAGAFLQRNSGYTGSGRITSSRVHLLLDYGAAPLSATDNDTIQVKVLGIEMVYIPQGSFYIGDGNGTNESEASFHVYDNDNYSVQITSSHVGGITCDLIGYGVYPEPAYLGISGIGIDGDGGVDRNDDNSVDNSGFPTGYNAFYLMKYELSQAQYRDFLNTLPASGKTNRTATMTAGKFVMTNTNSPSYRQGLKTNDGTTVGCDLNDNDTLDEADDGQSVAMNYLNWPDLCAYADWAGLRPMTELEYEKVARGTSATVYSEYAWGSASRTQAEGPIVNSGYGNEVSSTTGTGLSNYNGSGTDINAPLRVGFAATPATTTRAASGSGTYGNMDLSGNLWEKVVSSADLTGMDFLGTHGDGTLTSGYATNSDWPGYIASGSSVSGATGHGIRGGSFYEDSMNVSFRGYVGRNDTSREWNDGARIARSATITTGTLGNFQRRAAQSVSTDEGCGTLGWDMLDSCAKEDNSPASSSSLNDSYSTCLVLKYFYFNIPANAVINSITVYVKADDPQAVSQFDTVKVIKSDGTYSATNHAGATSLSGSMQVHTFGGDLWGESWTYSDINDTDFGVVMNFYAPYQGGNPPGQPEIEDVEIQVNYTPE